MPKSVPASVVTGGAPPPGGTPTATTPPPAAAAKPAKGPLPLNWRNALMGLALGFLLGVVAQLMGLLVHWLVGDKLNIHAPWSPMYLHPKFLVLWLLCLMVGFAIIAWTVIRCIQLPWKEWRSPLLRGGLALLLLVLPQIPGINAFLWYSLVAVVGGFAAALWAGIQLVRRIPWKKWFVLAVVLFAIPFASHPSFGHVSTHPAAKSSKGTAVNLNDLQGQLGSVCAGGNTTDCTNDNVQFTEKYLNLVNAVADADGKCTDKAGQDKLSCWETAYTTVTFTTSDTKTHALRTYVSELGGHCATLPDQCSGKVTSFLKNRPACVADTPTGLDCGGSEVNFTAMYLDLLRRAADVHCAIATNKPACQTNTLKAAPLQTDVAVLARRCANLGKNCTTDVQDFLKNNWVR